MKRIASLMLGLMVFTGCSDEVVLEENKAISLEKSDAQEVSQQNDASDEVKSEGTDTDIENVEKVEVSEEKKENSANDDLKETDEIKEYKTSVQGEIIDEGMYTHYLESSSEKNGSFIVLEKLDETRIELPTLQENKHIFDENMDIVKIKLAELEKENVLQYVEEPISSGYLIALNLPKMQGKYKAISYSLVYNDKEYGFVVSERNSDFGLTVVEEVTIENLAEATLIIMK